VAKTDYSAATSRFLGGNILFGANQVRVYDTGHPYILYVENTSGREYKEISTVHISMEGIPFGKPTRIDFTKRDKKSIVSNPESTDFDLEVEPVIIGPDKDNKFQWTLTCRSTGDGIFENPRDLPLYRMAPDRGYVPMLRWESTVEHPHVGGFDEDVFIRSRDGTHTFRGALSVDIYGNLSDPRCAIRVEGGLDPSGGRWFGRKP
jgi:hypothetical protein